jgi:predicted secreted protein
MPRTHQNAYHIYFIVQQNHRQVKHKCAKTSLEWSDTFDNTIQYQILLESNNVWIKAFIFFDFLMPEI